MLKEFWMMAKESPSEVLGMVVFAVLLSFGTYFLLLLGPVFAP